MRSRLLATRPAGGRAIPCLVAALALLLLAPAGAATAQSSSSDTAGPWRAGVFGGWYSGAHPYVFRGDFSSDVNLEPSGFFGLRLGYDLGPVWRLEWSWWQARSEETITNATPAKIRDVRLDTYLFNALARFGRGPVRGFVTFGLGGASTGSSFGGVNLTANLGLGAELSLDRHLAIRLEGDFYDTYGNIGKAGEPAFCDAAGCYYYKHAWYPSGSVSAGVSYAF
ncbi:MAG TPA: outer membrane beta-barrel protein [Thermoanaerobaculia bacterium]|nr:outer membrane beta-barrel protein [Thermoanaerobaculia bacterium]